MLFDVPINILPALSNCAPASPNVYFGFQIIQELVHFNLVPSLELLNRLFTYLQKNLC